MSCDTIEVPMTWMYVVAMAILSSMSYTYNWTRQMVACFLKRPLVPSNYHSMYGTTTTTSTDHLLLLLLLLLIFSFFVCIIAFLSFILCVVRCQSFSIWESMHYDDMLMSLSGASMSHKTRLPVVVVVVVVVVFYVSILYLPVPMYYASIHQSQPIVSLLYNKQQL